MLFLTQVDPSQTNRAFQRSPAVKDIDLTLFEIDTNLFETPKRIVGLFCAETSGYDHVISDREDSFHLSMLTASFREDDLTIFVPSFFQRAGHDTLFLAFLITDIIVVSYCWGRGNDDVLVKEWRHPLRLKWDSRLKLFVHETLRCRESAAVLLGTYGGVPELPEPARQLRGAR